MDRQHKAIKRKNFSTPKSHCINVKKDTTQGHEDTESYTLHTSVVLSIQGFSIIGYTFILFTLSMWGRYSFFYSWENQDTQMFNPVLYLIQGVQSTSKKICLQLCCTPWKCKSIWFCSTWKTTTTIHCPKDVPGGTRAGVKVPAPHQSLDQSRNNCAPGHHQACPMLRSSSLIWQVSLAGGVHPHLQHRNTISTLQKLGREVKYCPMSSCLILGTLCGFLGLFLKWYSLNISCCNAEYQLTSQEGFLNWYKLIIPHTHRQFLQQAWSICLLTTG